jgi:hypothetical protein
VSPTGESWQFPGSHTSSDEKIKRLNLPKYRILDCLT